MHLVICIIRCSRQHTVSNYEFNKISAVSCKGVAKTWHFLDEIRTTALLPPCAWPISCRGRGVVLHRGKVSQYPKKWKVCQVLLHLIVALRFSSLDVFFGEISQRFSVCIFLNAQMDKMQSIKAYRAANAVVNT